MAPLPGISFDIELHRNCFCGFEFCIYHIYCIFSLVYIDSRTFILVNIHLFCLMFVQVFGYDSLLLVCAVATPWHYKRKLQVEHNKGVELTT